MENPDNGPGNEEQLIFFLGTYPPRECGIATFTQDLANSIKNRFNPEIDICIGAINEDSTTFYNYPKRVFYDISQDDIEDYMKLAEKINQDDRIKVVSIQHEFGIFGGKHGNHIIPFLEKIEKPVVVTFHSILPNPDEYHKKVVKFILEKSAASVVMARRAIDILERDYEGDRDKIFYIPHGTPQIPLLPTYEPKQQLGLEDNIVLTTFGLLSKGKGIEHVIKSLPRIVEKYPNLKYLILGETHPQVRKEEGESYRRELKELVRELGLNDNVKFYNKHLSFDELILYLKATDIYLLTNLDKNQIVSGTLSYAFSCGKPIVSTKIPHALEILDSEVLVNFQSPKEYETALLRLLENEEERKRVSRRNYLLSRNTTWPNVAQSYLRLFEKVTKLDREEVKLPKIKLDHLDRLTDSHGMIQFADHSTPDINSGYTTDDNARALIVSAKFYDIFKDEKAEELSRRYLRFLQQVQKDNGDFYNYQDKDLKIMDEETYEDCFGRALWACGAGVYYLDGELRENSKKMFEKALKYVLRISHPRSKAFSILGLYYYEKVFQSNENNEIVNKLADSLVELYENNSKDNWNWFEDKLSYANSIFPEALLLAYKITGKKKYLDIGKASFDFLIDTTIIDNKFIPIGQNGWFEHDGRRAFFDQQPIETCCMVRACLAAFDVLEEKKYLNYSVLTFNWFLGKNSLNQIIYDESTGGCCDGLCPDKLNINQGAESTLSYLMPRLYLEDAILDKKLSAIS